MLGMERFLTESQGDSYAPATALAVHVKFIIPICNQTAPRTNISSWAQCRAMDPAPFQRKIAQGHANPIVPCPPPRLTHGKHRPRALSNRAWHRRLLPSRKSGGGGARQAYQSSARRPAEFHPQRNRESGFCRRLLLGRSGGVPAYLGRDERGFGICGRHAGQPQLRAGQLWPHRTRRICRDYLRSEADLLRPPVADLFFGGARPDTVEPAGPRRGHPVSLRDFRHERRPATRRRGLYRGTRQGACLPRTGS